MALTIESLKGLYEKLGGTNFGDVTTIPEALDKVTEVATGGGDTYETVAEIAVGTMEQQGGLYIADDIVANVPLGETLYFNSPEYEMEYNATMTSYLYNFSAETQQPTGTPAYVLAVDSMRVSIISDTDLSNTTVKILKKVSGGGSITVDTELDADSENPVQNKIITAALEDKADKADLKEPLIVHATNTLDVNTMTGTVTITDDIGLADIYDAAEAGCYVAIETPIAGLNGRIPLAGRALTNGEYSLNFNAPITLGSIAPVGVLDVSFANATTGTIKIATPQ